jgi:phage terminase small subunit
LKIPKSPNGLKPPGKRFWKKVLNEYDLSESHDLERLKMACRCLVEIEEAEKTVEDEGRFIKDRFSQTKEHPGARAIRDNKMLFIKIIRELNLDISTPDDSRPPRKY